jgi:serine/threonine-protein kinase
MEKRAHAGAGTESASNVRFGPFELDLRKGELRKEGRWIRLQEQPFQIQRMLLESPGEVVSREEIRKRLWPDETVVEFDHCINAAIRRLRDALRDSADRPRYIKTSSRRGYYFIGHAEADQVTQAEPVAVGEKELPRQAEETPRRPGPPLNPRAIVPVLVATIILIVGAGAWYYRYGTWPLTSPLQPLMRLEIDLGNDVSHDWNDRASTILSPDGIRLVYVSHLKLFTRRLDQAEATELPGTEGAQAPFFSPDGQWVGFFARGILFKVSIQKKQVIPLCDGSLENGGSWGEDGNLIIGFDFRLARVPSAGGKATPVTELAPGEIVHRWPQILPGGKAILFSAYRSLAGVDGATIEVVSLRDGRRKTLVHGGTWGRYLPSGHLVYINQGMLFAVPFDADRLELRGTPTPALNDIAYRADNGFAQIDFSRTGTVVYRSSKAGSGLVTVQWLDESGNTRPLLPVPGNYLSPTLSPDGNRLALISAGDIWMYELGRGSMTRLTFGGGYSNPLWTVDGRYFVFRAARGMWWTRADGAGQPQPLTQSDRRQIPMSFTPDGRRLAFNELSPATGDDIWTVSVEATSSGLRAGKPELFLQTPFHERGPAFSPDGRWIVYQSDESGKYEVYVRAFPDGHGKRQISEPFGTVPTWSRNGRDLFFKANRVLMAASYQVRGDSVVAETPRVWFEKKIANFPSTKSYDPAPDGKRIVALMSADMPEEPHDRVILLLKFFDELQKRVPTNGK